MTATPKLRLFLWTPLAVLPCLGVLWWLVVPSLPEQAVLVCGMVTSALLAAVQERRRHQPPRRIMLSAVGAGAAFAVLVATLLLWAFWDFDS
jgi:hypothetical protein